MGRLIAALAYLLALGGCLPTTWAGPSAPPDPTVTAAPAPVATQVPTRPPGPTATERPTAPTAGSSAAVNKRGVHLLLDDGGTRWPAEVWDEHVAWAARLVGRGGYVVQLIRSTDRRPEAWQPFFDTVAREGLVPIIRLATYKDLPNPWWVAPTPDDDGQSYHTEAAEMRQFFESIAWRSEQVIVTVGNEPNRADEWSDAADPAAYARYLRDVTRALRQVSNVRVVVLNGALDTFAPSTPGPVNLTWDPERFIEGMAAEVPGIFDGLDGWASHAYPLGPFGEHPARQAYKIDDVRPEASERPTPPDGLPNRGVNAYAWELWKLGQLGVRPLPVYVTESGWRHDRSQADGSLDAEYATVDHERLAEYLALAFDGPGDGWTPWNADRRVVSVSLFALGGKPEHWGHTNLLLIDPAGRVLAAYPFAERLARISPGSR